MHIYGLCMSLISTHVSFSNVGAGLYNLPKFPVGGTGQPQDYTPLKHL